MVRLFGTDGVRGVAGEDLTAQLAMDVSRAAASVLHDTGAFAAAEEAGRPLAVVGRDPRASGEFLEAAVVAGLASSGVDVLRLGVIPTPAVAFLTRDLDADLGVMLSASHNPAPDNGIKLFGHGGFKLPDAIEDQIEAHLGMPARRRSDLPDGFGRVTEADRERDRYLAHLLASVPRLAAAGQRGGTLTGLTVVVDSAHGAAAQFAPELLRRAGAEVIANGAEPDGDNINSGCGSTHLTHLEALSAEVTKHGADAGIAHDGDADRCLAVGADGEVIDGDQILAVLALALAGQGRLPGNTVVTTVMSNIGFRNAMQDAGITVVETAVGDRYVLEAMREGQFALGGEQSGHIIMLEHATTGDGLLTALQLLATAARQALPLAELVRPSGTEPAVRVMVEAVEAGQAQRTADRLAAAVRAAG
jgi:phosphoglucosamine mutase